MERICTQCARLRLNPKSATPLLFVPGSAITRGISTSGVRYDEGDRPSSGKPLSGVSLSKAFKNSNESSPNIIRKQYAPDSKRAPAAANGARQPPGSVLRRTAAPRNATGSAGQTGAAAGAGAGAGARTPPPGLLLRRTGAPRSGTPGQQTQGGRRGPPQAGGASGTGFSGRRIDKRVRRANDRKQTEAADAEEDDLELPAKIQQYISTIVDRPENPTEEIAHVPGKGMTIADLRADWPNTPLSTTGLTESVQQRIEWLAHRIPHGYQTPGQLAERYNKGLFTRFESEEEKEKVLALAAGIARSRADQESEKTGAEVAPQDMAFDDVVSRSADRQGLTDTYVRGKYPVVPKQKMPFLDQIARNLNNNASYAPKKTEQFMQTVQRLMVSQGGAAPKGAEK